MSDLTEKKEADITSFSAMENRLKLAEKVLVGIGAEWAYDYDNEDNNRKEKILNAYRKLKELLKDKDYYIITLCIDELIFEIFGDCDRIVAPCGSYCRLQCDEHLLSKEDSKRYKYADACPVCGKPLGYNNISNPSYLEEGYLPLFAEYKKWLMGTVNKKLCILELGCKMQFPTVIRMPFDKMCSYNLKSVFYRINSSLCQHTAENSERGISVKTDSVEYFL